MPSVDFFLRLGCLCNANWLCASTPIFVCWYPGGKCRLQPVENDLGRKGSPFSVRKASIDFLDTHPLGVHQSIGENGTGLSGGQAQRVSIARCMHILSSLFLMKQRVHWISLMKIAYSILLIAFQKI